MCDTITQNAEICFTEYLSKVKYSDFFKDGHISDIRVYSHDFSGPHWQMRIPSYL